MRSTRSPGQLLNDWREKEEFTVEFIKRTTGEKRLMRCTRIMPYPIGKAKKHVMDQDHKLVLVMDIESQSPKYVPVDGVLWMECEGERHEFERPSLTSKLLAALAAKIGTNET